MLAGWDETPGARGCTPQSCAFRDLYPDLGVPVAGLSAQTLDDQLEFAERNRMPFPVIADPERAARRRAAPADVRDRRASPFTSGSRSSPRMPGS